jgi:hypothetical protein
MSRTIFHLPPELRLLVYKEVLVLSEPIAWPIHASNKHPQLRALTPALLPANKTIYSEAIPLLYGGNRFDFTCLTSNQRVPNTAYLY